MKGGMNGSKHSMNLICFNFFEGRVMAQVVSRWPFPTEASVCAWVSPCGICGGQSGTGTGFL
jgi:hypothetical protein